MPKLFIVFISGLLLFTGCANVRNFDSYEEITISLNEKFEEGSGKGYEDGKNKETEYIGKLYPLQSSYSQYDLGYIDGYYVGCREVKMDCTKVEELTRQILAGQKKGVYQVETNQETTYPKK